MRTYVIDELALPDVEKVGQALAGQGCKNPLDGIFWIPLPADLLGQEQREHFSECGPYFLTLETGRDCLRLEMLVRAENRIRCSCVCYATSAQRDFVLDFLDNLLAELKVSG